LAPSRYQGWCLVLDQLRGIHLKRLGQLAECGHARLEDRLVHELMDAEERCELLEHVLRLRRRLSVVDDDEL
jgi:hypothetical protein